MILAALALASAAPPPAASPDGRLVAAFAEACAWTAGYSRAANQALGNGWDGVFLLKGQQFSDPQLRAFVAGLETRAGGKDRVMTGVFTRKDLGMSAYLVLTAPEVPGDSFNGCHLVSFGAKRPLTAVARQAMGSPPTRVQGKGAAALHRWDQVWKPGIAAEMRFVAPRSVEARRQGYSGIVLSAFARGNE